MSLVGSDESDDSDGSGASGGQGVGEGKVGSFRLLTSRPIKSVNVEPKFRCTLMWDTI
jgi:hypothetical protein